MFGRKKADTEEKTFQSLLQILRSEFALDPDSFHGPAHWSRVERYGLYLAQETGADPRVVRLFAIFHDCRRVEECHDPDHGLRGGERARALRDSLHLDDEAFETLFQACAGHTDLRFSHDPTIATCWDADRLDLDRVGIEPNPDYLSTRAGKLFAHYDAHTRRRMAGITVRSR